MQDIDELKRQGLSIRAISRLTGYCRKTVRKYLIQPDSVPVYGPREKHPGKLVHSNRTWKSERGQWCGMREYCCGSCGGYTLLTDWLRPQRESARMVAVRRFETPPGKQAQVDWGHLGGKWHATHTYSGKAAATRCRGSMRTDRYGCANAAVMWKCNTVGRGSRSTTRRRTLNGLGLKAVEARLESLLEQASKKEPSYADFLAELLGCEVDA